MSTVQEAALEYLRQGYHPVPVPYKSKKPVLRQWQKLRLTEEALGHYFNGRPQNIGLLCGEPSGNLADVDIDAPEAIQAARFFLPKTGMHSGRPSKPHSHAWYIVTGEALTKTVQFEDIVTGEDGKPLMLLELRFTGGQTIVPPSVHPSGEELVWNGREPACLDGGVLLKAVQMSAATALLARHWRAAGVRHNSALALAGFLLRGGMSPEEAERFVGAAAKVAGHNDVEDRVKAVWDTAKRLENKEPVTGGTRLQNYLDAKVITKLRQWLGLQAPQEDTPDEQTVKGGVYLVKNGCIHFKKRDRDSDVYLPLCNFRAQIDEEVISDDGADPRSEMVISGALADGRPLEPVRVLFTQFSSLSWATEKWGSRAIVCAGLGAKDRLREAIQLLSGDVPRRFEYLHSGWRKIGERWAYLHAGGAIGAEGVVVQLKDALEPLCLPAPPEGEVLHQAIHASLDILKVAPRPITAPLLGAVYRAPLNEMLYADLSVFLVGKTQVRKSELGTLGQQHFGAGFSRTSLPGSWKSTENYLERLLFDAKDAVVVIDDFCPKGNSLEVSRYHAKADNVLRGSGNRAPRGRMQANLQRRPDYPPRALALCTGEELPRGESLQGRNVMLEVSRLDVDLNQLTHLQQAGRRGEFALAMAGYLQWLAPQIDALREELALRFPELRAKATSATVQGRTPDNIAHLALGWRCWLSFAVDCGALSLEEGQQLWAEVWQALTATGEKQRQFQEGENPSQIFIDVLRSAVAGAHAHLTDLDNDRPDNPSAWGWRFRESTGEHDGVWEPKGEHIGWLDEENLYLDPNLAYKVVQRIGQSIGTHLALGTKMLQKHLDEDGFLVQTNMDSKSRPTRTVRKFIQGRQVSVLHLHASTLIGSEEGD